MIFFTPFRLTFINILILIKIVDLFYDFSNLLKISLSLLK
jgi:hypothetical protein